MTIDLPDRDLPEAVTAIVREAVAKHDAIGDATAEAEARIRALPDFASLVDELVRRAVAKLVGDMRHAVTTAIKKETGQYGTGGKIDYQQSEAVNAVFQGMYDLAVAGTKLGALYGEELPAAAETERNIGNGHLANARLLDQLRPIVKDGKRVRECVPEKRLRAIWNQVTGAAAEPKHKTNGHSNGKALRRVKPSEELPSR